MKVDSAEQPVNRSEKIAGRLLDHYDRHARALPWRAMPGDPPPDPYRVWLSEIMLQQTTVAAVIPYFDKFIRHWPTLTDLAAASDQDVMSAWAGLGYYSRARNLVACARLLIDEHGGRFPDNAADLRKLPGIGAYTSAAIAAIAFGERAAVVDANVERVAARLFLIDTPLPAAKKDIHRLIDTLTPPDRPGDFAQAMMDLGATICTNKKPQCLLCPLGDLCGARAAGNAEAYPVKPPKRVKPERSGTAFWIEREGKLLVVKRPDRGMLGGMTALPDDGWHAGADGDMTVPFEADWRSCTEQVSHGFTHFNLTLSVTRAILPADAPDPMAGGRWHPIDALEEAGLPTLFLKAAQLALSENRQEKAPADADRAMRTPKQSGDRRYQPSIIDRTLP